MTPPFVPSPPDSLRQSSSSESSKDEKDEKDKEGDGKGPSRLHYTKVWLSALKMGYSRTDLADMPYGEVVFDLAALNEDREEASRKAKEQVDRDGVEVRDATQEDIRTMLG